MTGSQLLTLVTKSRVQVRVGNYLAALANRKYEVKHRCRTVLESRVERLLQNPRSESHRQQTHIPHWPYFRG